MTTFDDLMNQVNSKRDAKRASDRAVAKATGTTVRKLDADTTVPDPLDIVQIGPHTFTPTKTGQPRGDVFRNCAICNETVIAEECIYGRNATYVRGFVTYGQDRATLDQWHKVSPK